MGFVIGIIVGIILTWIIKNVTIQTNADESIGSEYWQYMRGIRHLGSYNMETSIHQNQQYD